jgi:hypothetical protein
MEPDKHPWKCPLCGCESTDRICPQCNPSKCHPMTEKLVKDFTEALRLKLRAAEKKYGYAAEWADDGDNWPAPQCYHHLMQHLRKGDPRDVAIYCAFLWFHGLSTERCFDGEWHELAKSILETKDADSDNETLKKRITELEFYLQHKDELEYCGDKAKAELAQLKEQNRELLKALKRASQLASIAYDWDLGTDGKVEIDGEWVSCSDLRQEFDKAIDKAAIAKGDV